MSVPPALAGGTDQAQQRLLINTHERHTRIETGTSAHHHIPIKSRLGVATIVERDFAIATFQAVDWGVSANQRPASVADIHSELAIRSPGGHQTGISTRGSERGCGTHIQAYSVTVATYDVEIYC